MKINSSNESRAFLQTATSAINATPASASSAVFTRVVWIQGNEDAQAETQRSSEAVIGRLAASMKLKHILKSSKQRKL